MPVIDSINFGARADVVDEALCDVRRSADAAMNGAVGPSEVVDRPASNAACFIELLFGFAPTIEMLFRFPASWEEERGFFVPP